MGLHTFLRQYLARRIKVLLMLQDNEYYSVSHKAYLCLEAHLSVKDLN